MCRGVNDNCFLGLKGSFVSISIKAMKCVWSDDANFGNANHAKKANRTS
jgi:hypothetical protein